MDNISLNRINKLREACVDAEIDAFFVRETSNVQWLSAFDGVFDEEDAHAMLVTPDGATLHTDSRYSEACKKAARAHGGVVEVNDERVSHAKFAAAALGGACESALGESCSLGVEDSIALSGFRSLESAFAESLPNVQLRETSNFIVGLRGVKDADEIARMKAAQAITDAAFSHIITFMKPGMTEREVQIELEDFMVRHGAEGLAFPSIVACGANGASPHSVPGATKFEAGQCVVMDFGARAQGYCSDMTRTVFLGEPSERLRSGYAAIRDANEQVEAVLRPGMTGKEAHELAEHVLAEHGFAGKMGHSLGHGVGIDIHEEPLLSPRNGAPLVPGNVVTVEPGVYLAGDFGMRLEDFGVITENGYEVFTQSTHEMIVL